MSLQLLPKIVFGTSSLGNLFTELDMETKVELVNSAVTSSPNNLIFDSAGKYGAGLALESLGSALSALKIAPNKVRISNKLGWKRIPLCTPEPTFEPGAWVNLKYDAIQDISYQGILDCYHQGNELLGDYSASIVSVHDPDEYLAKAIDDADLIRRKQDILEAYRALKELKQQGMVESIGVGAKDVSVIDFISDHVQLDWAMFACSVTPLVHKKSTLDLLTKLGNQGVDVINSAVYNSGFLLGSNNFDYKQVSRESHKEIFEWRDTFQRLCEKHRVITAHACVQFSFLFPQIKSVALNSSTPARVKSHVYLVDNQIPASFWQELAEHNLLETDLEKLKIATK